MSREKVEVVRRGIDAFNARDAESFARLATEDFEWSPALPGAVGGGPYVGRSGIDRYFAEVADTWRQLRVECDELRANGEVVVMLGRAVGRGGGSGVGVEMPHAFVAEFTAGRIARVTAFLSHADALARAGLA
jgi:ketosteroid isomerase-like protein